MAAILKSAQKGGGGPIYKALTSRLLITEQNDTTHGGSWGVHGDPSGPMDYLCLLFIIPLHER